MVTVLCFFVMCYDFVIDIESTATETWGALTFHDYCLLIIAIDCSIPETFFWQILNNAGEANSSLLINSTRAICGNFVAAIVNPTW